MNAIHPQSAEQQHPEESEAAGTGQETTGRHHKLITRMYYDHVLGMLSDDRYQNMIADFEEQQERLKTEITVMEELIDWQREDSDNYDRFAALVEKYVDIPELITAIVNEFIKKIIVHEADKSSGHRRQTVEIIFNFVGQIEIPILTVPVSREASPKQSGRWPRLVMSRGCPPTPLVRTDRVHGGSVF